MMVMLLGTKKKQKDKEEIIIDDEESISIEMDIETSKVSNDETENL